MIAKIKALLEPDHYIIARLIKLCITSICIIVSLFLARQPHGIWFAIPSGLLALWMVYKVATESRYLPAKRYNINAVILPGWTLGIRFIPIEKSLNRCVLELVKAEVKTKKGRVLVKEQDDSEMLGWNNQERDLVDGLPKMKVVKSYPEYELNKRQRRNLQYIFEDLHDHYQIFDEEFIEWQLERLVNKPFWYRLLVRPDEFKSSPTPSGRGTVIEKTQFATNFQQKTDEIRPI